MLNKDEIERVRISMENNSRLNRHVCQWRKPEQVLADGSYAMIRSDDDDDNHFLVNIKDGYLVSVPMNDESDRETLVRDFDPECRFFGPIPDCKE